MTNLAHLRTRVSSIQFLDGLLSDIQDQRADVALPLEQAAHDYDKANPVGSTSFRRRCCSRCRFVLRDVRENGQLLVFGTDCSWCGEDDASGMNLSLEALAPYLPEEGA